MAGAASDAGVTTKVKSEFAATKGVDATGISATIRNGRVMPSGTVSGEAEIIAARDLKVAGSND